MAAMQFLVASLALVALLLTEVCRGVPAPGPAPKPQSDSLILGNPKRHHAGCAYQRAYGYLSADCMDIKLTEIPALRAEIQALNAEDNKITYLRNSTFTQVTNLRFLYLNENRIKVVEAAALTPLQYLEVLDLSGNRLQYLPHGLLSLPRLRKLYFADNLLEHLDPTFVFSSPTLQLLSLAECSLSDLPLGPMPELLTLNVSGNALTTLPLHDISEMCRLKTLDISKMPTLFKDLDIEDSCQCQTFTRWARFRELSLGHTKILCRNETNSADDLLVPSCNATEVYHSALDMHGRCVRVFQQELRATVRNWWVIGGCVVASSLLALLVLLAYCQRRDARHQHRKVPVVVMTDPHAAVPNGK